MKRIAVVTKFTALAALAAAPAAGATSLLPVNTRSFYLTAAELGMRLDQASSFGNTHGHDGIIEGHEGMMFVAGVADAIQGSRACPTPRQRESFLLTEVGDYIRSHPARADEPAAKVVTDALAARFPCPPR